MDGSGERGSTKHEAEAEYHSHDFEWEDLRADVEANPSFSYHLSPFPTTTASPQPPSSEAWRSFHRRHASGKFFKVLFPFSPRPPAQNTFYLYFTYQFGRNMNVLNHIGRECSGSWTSAKLDFFIGETM